MSSDPIVVGTDGSARAEVAVDRAGELAKALDASVHVVTVLESASAPRRAAGGRRVANAERGGMQAQDAADLVSNSRERLEARGVKVQTHVRTGGAAAELINIAESEHAQMIVVGNRGMAGAKRVLGSVPNDVSHYARCGVLIVPTEP